MTSSACVLCPSHYRLTDMCELTVETDCVEPKGVVAPSPVRKLSFINCQPMSDTGRVGFSFAQTAVRSPVGLMLSSKKSRLALGVVSNAMGAAAGDVCMKLSPRYPLRQLPDLPMDAWGRVFDFLLLPGNGGSCCASGDAVLSALASVLPAHRALTQVGPPTSRSSIYVT